MPRSAAATKTIPAIHLTPGDHIENPAGAWVPITAVTHGVTVAETPTGDAMYAPGDLVPTRRTPGGGR